MSIDVATLTSPLLPGLDLDHGYQFPDLELPSVETGQPTHLLAQGGDQVLVHLFASW